MEYTLILSTIIILLAGFVQSVTGFGFALVATPLFLFILELKSTVVTIVILSAVLCGLLLLRFRQHVDKRRAALIAGGSIFGIPIGAYVLVSINPSVIKLVIAIIIIPVSLLLLLGPSHQFKRDTLGSGLSGLISGVLVTSTTFGGPPVVLFLLNQGLVKERFIGTCAAYFLFCGLLSVGTFSFMGMVTTELLMKAAILLPALALGFYIGTKVGPKVNPILFKRIATAIVLISALAIIANFIVESA